MRRLAHQAAAGVVLGDLRHRAPHVDVHGALELLLDLAAPFLEIRDVGDTRRELLAAVENAIRGLTRSEFGPVMRALLSQIAIDPTLGDPFRATVVQARRAEIARVIERGVARGDVRPDADAGVITELLVGPVYFRLVFGGRLDRDLRQPRRRRRARRLRQRRQQGLTTNEPPADPPLPRASVAVTV